MCKFMNICSVLSCYGLTNEDSDRRTNERIDRYREANTHILNFVL
jgi:hypothetical protein